MLKRSLPKHMTVVEPKERLCRSIRRLELNKGEA